MGKREKNKRNQVVQSQIERNSGFRRGRGGLILVEVGLVEKTERVEEHG